MGEDTSILRGESEGRLQAILNTVVDGIITIDERGTVQAVNPAAVRIFGYTAEEMVGENVKMLMPSPYREEHDDYLVNYQQTGEAQIIGIGREVEGKRKDGSSFPLDLAVSEVKSHSDVGGRFFTGIVRDISERKRAEARATGVGHIIEDSLNEIFIFDATTLHFIQVNRGGRENLGYTLEELRGMTPSDIKPDFTADAFELLLKPLRDGTEQHLQFETVHCRRDGSVYNVAVHLQFTMLEAIPCFVAIILDITKRKQAEEKLQQLNERLEELVRTRTSALEEAQAELVKQEKLATLGQVSGGIAHEIRNPLNAVKTSAYYLLNAKSATPEKTREHLERIDRQVTVVDNVITALSDVVRLPDAKLRPVNLLPLVREAISGVTLPHNVTVSIDVPENIPQVLADDGQIPIVFKNLVRNARDAMPDGGELNVTATASGGKVSISFADSGSGIAPDDLSRIMEPLFSTKARGMGLGLSISSSIVMKNGGKFAVETREGHGSTFIVELKSADAEDGVRS